VIRQHAGFGLATFLQGAGGQLVQPGPFTHGDAGLEHLPDEGVDEPWRFSGHRGQQVRPHSCVEKAGHSGFRLLDDGGD